MNKLRQSIKLVLFISVASLFFAACSDDDDKSIPVPEPSRMITGIKVHKISDVITYQGMISLTYDNNKRLTRIYSIFLFINNHATAEAKTMVFVVDYSVLSGGDSLDFVVGFDAV